MYLRSMPSLIILVVIFFIVKHLLAETANVSDSESPSNESIDFSTTLSSTLKKTTDFNATTQRPNLTETAPYEEVATLELTSTTMPYSTSITHVITSPSTMVGRNVTGTVGFAEDSATVRGIVDGTATKSEWVAAFSNTGKILHGGEGTHPNLSTNKKEEALEFLRYLIPLVVLIVLILYIILLWCYYRKRLIHEGCIAALGMKRASGTSAATTDATSESDNKFQRKDHKPRRSHFGLLNVSKSTQNHTFYAPST
ncbi:unnamed protein product [Lymnaea stagnalis]|uniref:Uncharacterized protein n=1 Tax=Lymnaea stagnalis TaxID=6523 RepID=A0AAV2I1E1_LYMST